MKNYFSLLILVVALFNVKSANAGLIYNFVDSGSADVLAVIDLDTNVGELTHSNFLSFHFTERGNDIFGLGLNDLSSKFYRTANGTFRDNGAGVLVNPSSSLVFVSSPYADFPYEGPEPDFLTLYFHLKSGGSSISFSTRDSSGFFARVDGDWVNATAVNEPSSLMLFSLIFGLVMLRQKLFA